MTLTQAGWWSFLVCLFLLIVLVPEGFGVAPFHHGSGAHWLVAITLFWASFRIAQIFAIGADQIVSLFFWVFVYMFLGLAPLVQLEQSTFALPGVYSQGDLQNAATISLVGLFAYEIARHRPSLTGQFWRVTDRLMRRRVDVRRVLVVGTGTTVLALLILQTLGGPSVLLSSRQSISAAIGQEQLALGGNASGALRVALLSVPTFLIVVLVIGSWPYMRGQRSFMKLFPWPWLIVVLAVGAAVNNPIIQPRFWVATVLVSVGALSLRLWRKATFRLFVIAAVFGVIVVFPYADRFRYDSRETTSLGLSDVIIHKSDHDAFQELANASQYVDDEGVVYGRQLLAVFAFWVPRSIWSAKPIDTGPLIGEYKNYSYTNISAPLWSEGYVNLGFPGTALFLYVFGRLSEALESAWLRRRRVGTGLQPVAVVVPVFAAYQLILLRGSLLQAVGRPAVLLVVLWLCTRRAPSGSKSTRPVALDAPALAGSPGR